VPLVRGEFDFVLQHSRGPQQPHDVGLRFAAQADEQVVRRLHFEFLVHRAGKNFDLGADGAPVVRQPLQRKLQPVVPVSAVVPQQHRPTA
jgi:hypothetical protein